jgi:hypothetical protein
MIEISIVISTIIVLSVLFIYPFYGVMLLFIVRPLVDTMYGYPLIGDLRLTEIVSVLVPCIIAARIVLIPDQTHALKDMPLKSVWFLYAIYISFSSLIILYCEDLTSAANVFFRHINGFIGFYMVQAYFTDKKIRYFLLALVLAGVFPMTIGIYEFATNHHWHKTFSEGLLRNIGLYHDAITMRYYALQTIFGVILYCSMYIRSYLVHLTAFVYACASSIVMYKTYSKAGIIILSTWLLSWAVLKRNILLLIFLICLGITVACVENGVLTNINKVFNKEIGAITGTGKKERVLEGRIYLWSSLINEWKEQSALQKTFGTGKMTLGSHNDYLLMLFHGGVVGLLIYLALLISIGIRIIFNLYERAGPLNIGAFMAFFMWMTDSIGLVPSAYSGYQWFVWGVIGLGLREHRNEKLRKAEVSDRLQQDAATIPPLFDVASEPAAHVNHSLAG